MYGNSSELSGVEDRCDWLSLRRYSFYFCDFILFLKISYINQYYHTLINNINVFIHKSAIEDDIKLEFVLRKFLFHEYVDVDGIRIL